MCRKYVFSIIFIAVCIFYTEIVLGGMEYIIKCNNKECNYSAKVCFGGGISFGQITGFCTTCNDFVYIHWEASERMIGEPLSSEMLKDPSPIAQVWDLSAKEPIPIYECPKCSKPFVKIYDIENIKYCPKCKRQTLSVEKSGLMYD